MNSNNHIYFLPKLLLIAVLISVQYNSTYGNPNNSLNSGRNSNHNQHIGNNMAVQPSKQQVRPTLTNQHNPAVTMKSNDVLGQSEGLTSSNVYVRGGGGGGGIVKEVEASSSKIRNAIFPVYGIEEITKFMLLGFLKFFIIIALTLTRDTKDTLIVTQCGAEAISFLKIYGVLPAAIAFTALYGKASNIISNKEALFNVTCVPFFAFFVIYDILVRPNLGILEPSVETVHSVFGTGMSEVVVSILSHWTSALFFVVAEIYSSVSIGILFWKTANDFVSVSFIIHSSIFLI